MSEFDAQPGEAPAAAPTTEAPATETSPEGGAATPDFNKLFETVNSNTEAMQKFIEQQSPQAPPEGYVNPFETPAPSPYQPPQQPQAPQQPQYDPAQQFGPDDDWLAGDPNLGYPDTQMADITEHPAFQQMQQQLQQSQGQLGQLTQMFDHMSTREASAEVVSMHPELEDPQKANEASMRAFQFAQQEGFPADLARNPKFVGMVLAQDKELARQATQTPAPAPAGDNFESPGGPGPSGTQDEGDAMHQRMLANASSGF